MHGIIVPSINSLRGARGLFLDTPTAHSVIKNIPVFTAPSACKASFSIWDLAGWLLENSEEIKGYYSASHTNKSNRTENIQKWA